AAVAQWVFEHRRAAGLGTDTLPAAGALYLPLGAGTAALGVLGVRPDQALLPLGPAQLDLLEALGRQVGSALERVRLASEAESARVAAEGERLRNALLSSVSHDLRTPLGVIQGAASTLLDAQAALDAATRQDMLETIREEADRLNRRVRNLLDMTRLEAGSPPLEIEWQSLEEIVGAALERVERGALATRVSVRLPPALPLVACDGALLELVLVNLLENALKYAPPGTPIELSALETERELILSVKDEGPGVPEAERERVFEKFHRGAGARG